MAETEIKSRPGTPLAVKIIAMICAVLAALGLILASLIGLCASFLIDIADEGFMGREFLETTIGRMFIIANVLLAAGIDKALMGSGLLKLKPLGMVNGNLLSLVEYSLHCSRTFKESWKCRSCNSGDRCRHCCCAYDLFCQKEGVLQY